MAGVLKQLSTVTASTSSTVTLTGITTNNPHMIVISDCFPVTDAAYLRLRWTVGGSVTSSSDYDSGMQIHFAASTIYDSSVTNSDGINITQHTNGTGNGEGVNAIINIYNPTKSSVHTFATVASVGRDHGDESYGTTGGLVQTANQAIDGVQFAYTSGNILRGDFTLYEVT